jgi:hypothetical protein
MKNSDSIEIELTNEGTSAHITIGSITVRVTRTDEGAICDMYSSALYNEDRVDDAHLGTCYVFFSEAEGLGE